MNAERLIRTVLGDVPVSAMGPTSVHEHLFLDASFLSRTPGVQPPPEGAVEISGLGALRAGAYNLDNLVIDDVAAVEEDIADFAAAGGSLLVDLTVTGIRNRLEEIPDLSRRTGVHVVASTGLYTEPSWPERFRDGSVSQFFDHLMGEITDGIDGTGIRPGHIGEIGISDLGEAQRRLLRAAAQASAASGLPLSIHVSFGMSNNLEIAEVLLDAGARPDRVIMGHSDGHLHGSASLLADPGGSFSRAMERMERLLALGVNISVDTFGHEYRVPQAKVVNDDDRLAMVHHLVSHGYADQILLGTDVCFKMHHKRWGGYGYRHLLSYVAPALENIGTPPDAIATMLQHNPRRVLAMEPGGVA